MEPGGIGPLSKLDPVFTEWMERHGEECVALQIVRIGQELQKEVTNDLNVMDAALGKRMVQLAYVNEKLADAQAFYHQAFAMTTEYYHDSFTGNALRDVAKGKAVTYFRTQQILDRLSATITHQMDALRTRISMAKEEWKSLSSRRA